MERDPMVCNPPHYDSDKGFQVIDVIEAYTKGMTGIEAVCAGNIIKYACRWKRKGGKQDLEKMIWYAEYLENFLPDNAERNDASEYVQKP